MMPKISSSRELCITPMGNQEININNNPIPETQYLYPLSEKLPALAAPNTPATPARPNMDGRDYGNHLKRQI